MADSDSDEDTFVTIGTHLEPLSQGDAVRKPITVQDQTAKDEKGRQRFHGAFTGGFSAGYFNTVGTKEGWTPSTFVSSRTKKSDASVSQKPEEYMDVEDFGEFGIAPKQVTTSEDFLSGARETERKRKFASAESVIPQMDEIISDIVPAKSTIGVRLLHKMGWKEGQGIGPRARRKNRKAALAAGTSGTGVQVYGCPFKNDSESDESDHEDYPANVTFAPKDSAQVSFEAKDNLHGIGYSGIDPTTALRGGKQQDQFSLFEPTTTGRKKKGMRGQAFGVGALEDNDDDIYGMDSMANYDSVLTTEEDSNLHGWTAPGSKVPVTSANYVGKLLEGFTLSTKPLPPKKVFPPPKVPRDFKPIHCSIKRRNDSSKQKTFLNASSRQQLLEEKPEIGSVFELVSKGDREKMETAKSAVATKPQEPSTPSLRFQENFGAEVHQNKTRNFQSGGFKPFAKNPEKQIRYEEYLKAMKEGKKFDLTSSNMTDWESERENEEFIRAAQLYRPLSCMMASRFTSAKFEDNIDAVEIPAEEGGDKNDQSKAAELKMFGRLTRDVLEWHPDRLLCKRFNIPDPYPGSTIVGLPTVRKDKFSVFNFLNFSQESEEREVEKEASPPKAIEYTLAKTNQGTDGAKKVNIFSKIDQLQRGPSNSVLEKVTEEVQEDNKDIDKESEGKNKIGSGDDDRPPMDLFKAIFQDSEESSSSSDEDESRETFPIKETPALNIIQGNQDSTGMHNQQKSDTVGVESVVEHLSPPIIHQVESEDEYYGPPLPPSDQSTVIAPANNGNTIQLSKKSFIDLTKQPNRKSKHRHKDKKSSKKKKLKKHKYKTKKKKRESRKKKAPSSDDSSDYEGSSEESDDDSEILKRLKQLPAGKRPTAADFM